MTAYPYEEIREHFVGYFTEDVDYVEHHYGRFKGRQAVREGVVRP